MNSPPASAPGKGAASGGRRVDVSAVVVHYRAPGLAGRAVASLRREAVAAGVEIEVLVVDNGSDRAGRERLAGLPCRLLEPGTNLGFAGGVNLGAAASAGDVLLLANPDVELLPGSLARLLATLRGGADVAGPRLLWDADQRFLLPPAEPRDRISELAARLAPRGEPWARWARRRWRRHARRHWQAEKALASHHLSGALLAVGRAAWERTGPFDAGYRLYFEETDWLLRARRQGLCLVHEPRAAVLHHYNRSAAVEPRAAEWFADSAERFARRWYGPLFRALCRLAAPPRSRLSFPSPLPAYADRADGGAGRPLSPAPRRSPDGERPANVPTGPLGLDLTRWSDTAAGLWIELSPSPQGVPAAAERLSAGATQWRMPAALWRGLDGGRLAPHPGRRRRRRAGGVVVRGAGRAGRAGWVGWVAAMTASRRRTLWVALGLVVIVLAFDGRLLTRGFTSEDFLLLRVLRQRPPWHDLGALFAGPWLGIQVVRFYRPLALLLLALEARFFGGHPAPYEAVHLALHALNALLVYRLAARLSARSPNGTASLSASGGPGGPRVPPATRASSARSVLAPSLTPDLPPDLGRPGRGRPWRRCSSPCIRCTRTPSPGSPATRRCSRPPRCSSHRRLGGVARSPGVERRREAAEKSPSLRVRPGAHRLRLGSALLRGGGGATVRPPAARAAAAGSSAHVADPFGGAFARHGRTRPAACSPPCRSSPSPPCTSCCAARSSASSIGGYGSFASRLGPAGLGVCCATRSCRCFASSTRCSTPRRRPGRQAAAVVLLAASLPLLVALRRRDGVRRPAAEVRSEIALWLFAWGWMVVFLAPFAFQPFVPANGRFAYLAGVGTALALTQLARLGWERLRARGWRGEAVPRRRWNASAAAGAVALALVALVAVGWGVRLAGLDGGDGPRRRRRRHGCGASSPRPSREARAGTAVRRRPSTLRAVAGGRAARPGAALRPGGFARHRPSRRPPRPATHVRVYPLPEGPTDGAPGGAPRGLRPVAPAASLSSPGTPPAAASGRRRRSRPAGASSASPPPRAACHAAARPAAADRWAVSFVSVAGAGSYRLVVLTRGNPAVVDVPPPPSAGQRQLVDLPADFIRSMRHLYAGPRFGGPVYWWIEARDPAGRLLAVSPARALPGGRAELEQVEVALGVVEVGGEGGAGIDLERDVDEAEVLGLRLGAEAEAGDDLGPPRRPRRQPAFERGGRRGAPAPRRRATAAPRRRAAGADRTARRPTPGARPAGETRSSRPGGRAGVTVHTKYSTSGLA